MPDTDAARPSKKLKTAEGSVDTSVTQAAAGGSGRAGAAGVGKKPKAAEPESKPGVIKPGGKQQQQQPSRLRTVAAEKVRTERLMGGVK